MMPEVKDLVGEDNTKENRPPTLADFIATQAEDLTCRQYAATIGHPDLNLTINVMDA